MIERIARLTAGLADRVTGYRRDFHRHAESGWVEFRTASLVARRLTELGYQVAAGRRVISADDRMGVPSAGVLAHHRERARRQGADEEFLEAVRDGFTGVVGVLTRGDGPVVALRFDMDALDISESDDPAHRPVREGFASVNAGMMHGCGHDGHTAVGLGIAEILAGLGDEVRGTVKLVFQPAEEGVRGAKSMVAAGVLDDVDYLFGHHFYTGWLAGEAVAGMSDYAATKKFDVLFTGAPAHAGGSPQTGRNALLAAASAVLNLHAIPRHGRGRTRVNVGRMEAGTGRNVVPDRALLVVETRGETTELSEYMYDRAVDAVTGAALMHGCTVEVRDMGAAPSGASSPELADRIQRVAEQVGGFRFFPPFNLGGSEDFTYMMERVQERGGLATNVGFGADTRGIGLETREGRDSVLRSHTDRFDFDEGAMVPAMTLLVAACLDVMASPGT